jgi:large subunit ribosomal protein L44
MLRGKNARLSDMGVDSHLQIQNNEELAVAGGEMISKFTNGYLRAVFTRVPEELIMYDSYSILPNV